MNLLLDEHIDPNYLHSIRRFELESSVRRVGELDAPKVGTKDPDILVWCEENNFALVTNNRKSMPAHLKDHLESGRHVEGIFVINLERSLATNAESLAIIAAVALPNEFADRITFVPLT